MAESAQIRQLQNPDNSIDIYPITVTDAVFDENGVQLASKLNAINASILSVSGSMDSIQSDIATVEPSSTSAHEYAVGDHLMYNSQLYEVIQAIAVDDTLTPGTNVKAVTITDEMGSGGHTILNPTGTAMTQRTNLQFKRSTVTDDPTNDRIIVTPEGSIDYRELDLTQSDLSTSTAYARYPYEYSFSWIGATAVSYLQAQFSVNGAEYTKPYALSGASDSVTIYFSEAITGTLHCVVYLSSTAELSDSSLLQNYVSKYEFSSSIANNLTTTAEGKVLDARQGKVLDDKKMDVVEYEEDVRGINLLDVTMETHTDSQTVTYTVNADKTINVNGTATGAVSSSTVGAFYGEIGERYILTGCPNGGSSSTYFIQLYNLQTSQWVELYETGSGYEFTYSYPIRIVIGIRQNVTASNLVFRPMLTKSEYAGVPYTPYNHQSIQNQLNAQTGITGVRNLLPNEAVTTTINGITFTVNADGTITANGTATATAFLLLTNKLVLKAGLLYSMSAGSVIDGRYAMYGMYFNVNGTDLVNTGRDNRYSFSVPSDTAITECRIFVAKGQTVSNLVFKPILKLASDPDDTYVPYAMTNRELTEIKTLTVTASNTTSNASPGNINCRRCGKIVQLEFGFTLTAAVNVGGTIKFMLSGIPQPILGTVISGYSGSVGFFASLSRSLELSIRVIGSNAASGTSAGITGVFIST